MAQNNIIQTQELLDKLNATLAKHVGYLDAGADAFSRYNTSAKLPSDYIQNTKTMEQNQKALLKSTKDLEKETKKLQRERLNELKLQKKREQAFDKYEKQLVREQNLLSKTQGLYNRVQRGINQVTKEYQDLALRKELNGKLSAAEEVSLGKLEAKLNKYQSALKKVDANIGKHQRNVGNYKSGFDGLGFSVAQLSREMPAFANSVQTGFMAISNNIPMFVDEIQRLKKANIELAATGKPTTSVLRSVGKAIFSLNGMLGIGITILTVFAPKLYKWATGMSEAEEATKKATEEIEEQNKALRENIRLRSQQIEGVKDFLNQAELSKRLRDVINAPFADVEETEALLTEISERLSSIGVNQAKVLTDQNLLSSERLTIASNLLEIERLRNNLESERSRIDANRRKEEEIIAKFKKGEISAQQKTNLLLKVGSTSLTETLEIQKRINQLEEANNNIIEKGVELEFDRKDKSVKRIKETAAATDTLSKSTESYVKEIQKMISLYEHVLKLYDKNSKEAIYLQKTIDNLKQSIDSMSESIKNGMADLDEWSKGFNKSQKTILDWKNTAEKTLEDIPKSFLKNAGFGSLTTLMDGSFEQMLAGLDSIEDKGERTRKKFALYFNQIADIAKDAFAMINQFSQQNFEQQYDRLEIQKEVAIGFAGESAAAKEEIERQYEEKRKVIARKQAKAQKETALFNAIIGTAQGIVTTIANVGFPGAIPLIALIGAIGAAQIAMISSQQVPQYWQGGTVGGSQQIMVNDDPYGKKGSNYKEVVQKPNGQTLFPTGKNVKMTVPKGTVIHKTYDDFMSSLNSELGLNGIGFSDVQPNININGGVTKSEIKDVMLEHSKSLVNAINSKHGVNIDFNENGFEKYVVKGNTKQKILNARFRGKGRFV